MKEQLISLDTAKLAKEKGFDIPVRGRFVFVSSIENFVSYSHYGEEHYFNEKCLWQPTLSFLQQWLREVHGIHVSPIFIGPDTNKYQCRIDIENSGKSAIYSIWFTSYQECLDAGLQEALKLI